MTRLRGLALAAVAVALAAAPAAQADHVAPTVSATLTLGNAVRDCNALGVCARGRRATVSWNASCGPAAPSDVSVTIDVTVYGVRPDGTRFAYDGESLEDEPPLTGSMSMTAGPGVRFHAEVVVTCRASVVDASGDLVEHQAQASSGRTAEFFLPPQLVSFQTTRSGFCGVRVPTSKVDKWLQAGQYAELAYTLSYSGASLMKRGVAPLRQIKLFARGAGVRVKRSPYRRMLRELGEIGTWLTPRRGGTLKIWATIGGHRTNTLRVRVLPKRC